MTVYTIGHSTRTLEVFVDILRRYKIDLLVDVRSVPRSRHTPQFNEDNLMTVLPKNYIEYVHLEKLGGLRHTSKDSINLGWRNESFRGYADYMQTAEFAAGINDLLRISRHKIVTIMCAEAVPWRCHRSLIGDALIVRGHKVIDIFDQAKAQDEKITEFARVESQAITYPKAIS